LLLHHSDFPADVVALTLSQLKLKMHRLLKKQLKHILRLLFYEGGVDDMFLNVNKGFIFVWFYSAIFFLKLVLMETNVMCCTLSRL